MNNRSASLGLPGFAQLAAGVAAVGMLHVVVGFTLYWARTEQLSDIFFSDLLVFDLPVIGAIGLQFFLGLHLLRFMKPWKRLAACLLLAACATTFSFYALLFCAFNTFGS